MDMQSLVRERVIGNIKTGKKGSSGLPQKLSYFHVEEDKGTSSDMVDVFKQLYPNKPTKLKIRFTNENPFNFKFKRYVNGKVVCIGNGEKAITVSKDDKNNAVQIEVECSKNCQYRKCGKCKLKGSLKFELEGINAGGVWNLSTSGGLSLSNIASEIVKYKKAEMSIVGVPFELSLTEQQSLAYGSYYSIDLRRTDIKPQVVAEAVPQLGDSNNKQLGEGTKKEAKTTNKKIKEEKQETVVESQEKQNSDLGSQEDKPQEDYTNYCILKSCEETIVKGIKFNQILFEKMDGQNVEYILHPKANKEILKCGIGTVIEVIETKTEMEKNVLCLYNIKNKIEELEQAV